MCPQPGFCAAIVGFLARHLWLPVRGCLRYYLLLVLHMLLIKNKISIGKEPVTTARPPRHARIAAVLVAVAALLLMSAAPAAAQRGPVRLAQAEGEDALCEAFESFVFSEFDQEFVEDVFDAAVRADAVPNSVLLALRDLNESELEAAEADELLATVNDELGSRCGIEGPEGAGFNTGSPGSDSGDEADDEAAGDEEDSDNGDSDDADSDDADGDEEGSDDDAAVADDGDAEEVDEAQDEESDHTGADGSDADEIVTTGPGSNNGTSDPQPSAALDELPRTGGPRESVLVIGLSFAACCLVVLGSALRLIEDRA